VRLGGFTHGALTPDDAGELRYAVTASGGKVIVAFGTPVEVDRNDSANGPPASLTPLNKWASET